MTRKVIDRGKRSMTLSEVKPVENRTPNVRSDLCIYGGNISIITVF